MYGFSGREIWGGGASIRTIRVPTGLLQRIRTLDRTGSSSDERQAMAQLSLANHKRRVIVRSSLIRVLA